MKRETYKGRKIKVVAGRGADFGYTRITLNGVNMGKWTQSEDEALRSTRSTIDHADEVGVSSGRYGAEWYAPGTYELCENGHAKEVDGECGHHYCAELRAESDPTVDDEAPSLEILTPEGPDQEGDGYYVTVRDGARSGLLLGPYATHDAALGNLDRARMFVLKHVPFGQFYAYGTCRIRGYGRKLKSGRLNDRIGLTA
ncbi:hypothetical protein [Streptomyces sp. bgisy153]|uniref:hypothetical protein n=1 Tax=Streptomyces sp. bgisy153 TaxID=3413793 RepID=UPI003D737B6E